MNIMPKTYRDAVLISHELNIQYLWIDSLCIIQDDPLDWEEEVARMDIIYEGAQVTLAAAWGVNADSGCFREHVPRMIVEVNEINEGSATMDEIRSRIVLRPRFDSYQSYFVKDAPLSSRAWTLQEFILSRRVLFFAEVGMYWYCSDSCDVEDHLDSTAADKRLPNLGKISRGQHRGTQALYDSWQDIIRQYSNRSLTYPADKLAALAGIIRLFLRGAEDTPLVGLWGSDIHGGLLWSAQSHNQIDEEAVRILEIPSWSWLKMKGGVNTYDGGTTPCMKVLASSVTWTDLPLVSKIKDASIQCRGKYLEFSIQLDEAARCLCMGLRIKLKSLKIDSVRYPGRMFGFQLDVCSSWLHPFACCLPISIREIPSNKTGSESMDFQALIVLPVHNSSARNAHKRIGVLHGFGLPRHIFDSTPESVFTLV